MTTIVSCFVFMLINTSCKAAEEIDKEALGNELGFYLKEYQSVIGENVFIKASDATDALGLKQKRGQISHNAIVKRIDDLDLSIVSEQLILGELRKVRTELGKLRKERKRDGIPLDLYHPMVKACLNPWGLKKVKKLSTVIMKRRQRIEVSRSTLEELEKMKQITASKVARNITVSNVARYMKKRKVPLMQEALREYSIHALSELLGQ